MKKIKYFRYVLLWIFIIIVAILMLTRLTTLKDAIGVLRMMSPLMLCLAVAAQVCSYLSSGYQMQKIVNIKRDRISLLRGTLIYIAGESIGLAGGMAGTAAATYLWVEGDESDSGEATLAGLMPIVYNSIVLITIAASGMAYLLFKHDLSSGQIVFYGSILAILILYICVVLYCLMHRGKLEQGVFAIAAMLNRFKKRKYELSRLQDRFDKFYGAITLLRDRAWLKCAIGSALNTGFDMLTIFFFFSATGYPISPSILIAGYSLAFLLGRTTFIVPGGAGVIEGGMAAIYLNLGIPNSAAITTVLGYRFLSFWLPSLLGFGAMLYLQKKSHRA